MNRHKWIKITCQSNCNLNTSKDSIKIKGWLLKFALETWNEVSSKILSIPINIIENKLSEMSI